MSTQMGYRVCVYKNYSGMEYSGVVPTLEDAEEIVASSLAQRALRGWVVDTKNYTARLPEAGHFVSYTIEKSTVTWEPVRHETV